MTTMTQARLAAIQCWLETTKGAIWPNANEDFIAEARETISELIEEIERLRCGVDGAFILRQSGGPVQ